MGIENVGKKTARDLSNSFVNIENLMNADKEKLLSIDDVGEIVAESIYTFFNKSENILEIRRLIGLGIEIVSEEKTAGGIFDGEKVVLTGTLQDFKRDDAMRIIEGFGGEIMSSVSKKTTLVIAGENAGSKLEKAKSLGIKIIDEETFKMLIKT